MTAPAPEPPREWAFLTNHAHVLLCLRAHPDARIRDVASAVGITERAAQRILGDLEAAGYISHERIGRRNRYVVHADRPMRHPMWRHHQIHELLDVLTDAHLG